MPSRSICVGVSDATIVMLCFKQAPRSAPWSDLIRAVAAERRARSIRLSAKRRSGSRSAGMMRWPIAIVSVRERLDAWIAFNGDAMPRKGGWRGVAP